MRSALEDLQLDRIAVFYPGEQAYPLAEKVTAVPVSSQAEAVPDVLLG